MHLRHILKQTKKVKLPSTGWYVFTLLLFLGFLIFEVTRMSYAQTAFKYPTALPPSGNPPPPAAGGGGTVAYDECAQGLFVGISSGKYEKSFENGYIDADEICNSTINGSHVCHIGELQKTIRCNPDPSPFDQFVGNSTDEEAWVNSGAQISTVEVNDCRGWTVAVEKGEKSSTTRGTVWLLKEGKNKYGYGYSKPCKEVVKSGTILRPFTCCK